MGGGGAQAARTGQCMRHLRFNLANVFVVITVAGLLLWANLRQRVVVSNSPSAFGLPGLVSIRFLSGWPVTHSWTSFLVMRDEAETVHCETFHESAGGMESTLVSE